MNNNYPNNNSMDTFNELFGSTRKPDTYQSQHSSTSTQNSLPNLIENIKGLESYVPEDVLRDVVLTHDPLKTSSIDTTLTGTTISTVNTSSTNSTFSKQSKEASNNTTVPSASNIPPIPNTSNIHSYSNANSSLNINTNSNSHPTQNINISSNPNDYILSKHTHIRNVSDTHSLSSVDSTPRNSPMKPRTYSNEASPNIAGPIRNLKYSNGLGPSCSPSKLGPPKSHFASNNLNPQSSNSSLNSNSNNSSHSNHNSHSEMMNTAPKAPYAPQPRKKPSLPQLAIAGLKKQTSFTSLNSNGTPVQPKKSPLQGFGIFTRSSSRDLHEQKSYTNVTSPKANFNQSDQRTSSLTSYSLKNFTSSLQSKNSNTRKSSQRSMSSPTNPIFEHSNGSSTGLNYPLSPSHSYDPSLVNNQNSSQHYSKHMQFGGHIMGNNNNNHSTGSLGLGIKMRQSSPAMGPKRYTSTSSNSSSHTTGLGHSHSHSHGHGHPHGHALNQRRSTSVLHNSRPPIHSVKKPLVYAAMLSKVSIKFKTTIQLGEHKKDGLVYRDAFTGIQAVDCLCHILRTTDRNLALLLGRALDAQKLFHDVVYEHRLRDSPQEVYELTENSRIIGAGTMALIPNENGGLESTTTLNATTSITSSHQTSVSQKEPLLLPSASFNSLSSSSTQGNSTRLESQPSTVDLSQTTKVNGVFTLLSECYSPTCTRDHLCYSISCPRRLEQQSRLNIFENRGLRRNISMNLDDDEEERPSWTSSVPKEIWENLSKKEIKRQEAIYEVFSTEKNFVKSLETTRDTFMKTLAETNIIPADIRKNFIKHVFAHINDIYSVNRRFLEALSDRQKSSPVARGIGDIILRFIPFFEPFVSYVASRPYAKYLIETQRSVNPYFARFDDDMMNSSLRHGIDSFLSQGVSRPGRYMLLVREIIKSSDEEADKRDLECLNGAMEALRDFMKRIDKASGAAQDRHDVKLLKQNILFKNEYVNMGLNNEKRKIKHEGVLSKREAGKSDDVLGDIQYYLLDNMLLFLKAKAVNKWHQRKVFQRPIPLPLLFVSAGEDMPTLRKYIGSKPDCSGTVVQSELTQSNPKNAITFYYYGAKHRYMVTLYAGQSAGLLTLIDKIKQEQARIISETHMFNVTKISDKFFDYSNKINSVVSCDGGRKLLIGTNSGLYMSNIKRQSSGHSKEDEKNSNKKPTIFFSTPVQLLQRSTVQQVNVLEEFQTILLLIDKKLYSCPYGLLQIEGNGSSYFKKHSKELVNHVRFFSEGNCNGKKLIVTAHAHSIKYFEPEHPLLGKQGANSNNSHTNVGHGNGNANNSHNAGVGGIANGRGKNAKKKIVEVSFDSEPVSISFLKSNLCIGCKKGFQIVSITQNLHEPLLDPADTSLEFATRDNTLKPMAIYRVGSMFLLCYTEFAFFVNNQGWRKKDSEIIYWEGEPQKFAIWYPYVLAFDSNFIEIRKIDNGELVRCVIADKIRLLQTSSQEILYVYEDNRGYDTVASLDFWG
ncbi:hypothetical protein TBLA_0I02750 [Henningerozyma blattae CBS 6284]|uniref:DH domain-containing protein n=1 Tax=Henningerozyma blattae (strain ATCC 34711 / CBS 6284 / DSM 70876 / NBRC 10599 / NRRL Y-10934 / UCD 77-7) TaxID=1071380 RepID=I2H979_HENB6|nr:hypothetical protein TBLA_0I02750 [Tetrapisispora blattae CBS 6284]CCH62931.1 hypothetical protein TBLA_0I02750 [Tetrapisispora blattae CBS 6284]